MSWKVAALSAVTCLGLCVPGLKAQDASVKAQKDTNAVAPAAAASSSPAPAEAASSSSGKGLLGPVRIGPSVAIGVPHPVTGALDIVYRDIFSLTLASGSYALNVSDTKVKISSWDANLRWFPFQGSFYIGAGYGGQEVDLNAKAEIDYIAGTSVGKADSNLHLIVKSNYVMPQFGWFARWDFGLTLGFDFGLMLPSGVNSKFDASFDADPTVEQAVLESEDYSMTKDDVEKAGKILGKTVIPCITLLRIGFLI